MKKAFLGLIVGFCLMFISLEVMAFDDYIVLSKMPVKKVVSSDEEVVRANVLTTLMNEKDTVLVKSVAKGKAVLSFEFYGSKIDVPFEVKDKKTTFKLKDTDTLQFVKIDIPPEYLEVDEPPVLQKEVK